MDQNCDLLLSNGDTFNGKLIGAPFRSGGELVFTTGMVGYTETLTDPSYFGQILVFTYPLIGNYGVPRFQKDREPALGFESSQAFVSGVVIANNSLMGSHWDCDLELNSWLSQENVPAITGVDTRHLTHLIRSNPGLKATIIPENSKGVRVLANKTSEEIPFTDFFDPGSFEVLGYVSDSSPKVFGKGKCRVAVIDCGVKWSLIRHLVKLDCEVVLVPFAWDFDSINCDGWIISNGPGDPAKSTALITKISKLITQNVPVLGVCLGHQLLSLASGARTKKMNFGHRGHNQPVINVETGLGYMTTQNHGYLVEESTLSPDWKVWFLNANDSSVEGISHKTKNLKSVQFHPEASAGPRDTLWILEDFIKSVGVQKAV